jgi:hypothetical protein
MVQSKADTATHADLAKLASLYGTHSVFLALLNVAISDDELRKLEHFDALERFASYFVDCNDARRLEALRSAMAIIPPADKSRHQELLARAKSKVLEAISAALEAFKILEPYLTCQIVEVQTRSTGTKQKVRVPGFID